MPKKRILFIGEGVTLAHIVRPLILAKALCQNKYDIFFACDERFKDMVANEGLNWQRISSMKSSEFLSRLTYGKPLYTFSRLKEYVEEDLSLISQLKPDLIVGDFRLSLDISSKIQKTPYVSLVNAYWSPYSTLKMPLPELSTPLKYVPLPLRRLAFNYLSFLFLPSHYNGFNKVRKAYGLPTINNIKEMYTSSTWTLYLDHPLLVPTHALPSNHQYLGPVCEMLSLQKPEWWEKWPDNKPVIYLSFGSSGDITLLNIFIDMLKDLDVSVILTTSGRVKETRFPKNFYVAQYVSGLEAARVANLFITNGGSGAVYQGLTRGVPILGLPSNMDQFFLMEQIEKLGAGILIRPSQATKENTAQAVKALLQQNTYKDIACTLGEQIRESNTINNFKDFIANIL